MQPAVHLIALAEIDAQAVARDRTRLDAEALDELIESIERAGLRQPIELFELARPHGDIRYGLISGFRRLRAFRDLHSRHPERFAAIPAFLREPDSIPAILLAMVEENDVRADLSPWERGAVAARAVRAGVFPDCDAAVRALYPAANRHKRGRLRAVAELALEMDGLLLEPERLSERDCLRFAAAVAAGFTDLIVAAVHSVPRSHEAQWAQIGAVLRESETFPDEHPVRDGRPNPRRIVRDFQAPRHRLQVRRERTLAGFVLHVTGRDATTPLVNEIFDEIERHFRPG